MARNYLVITRRVITLFGLLLASPTHAAVYGSGLYGAGKYGQGFVQIGPVTLPATGPQLLAVVSALIAGIGIGWFSWLRQKRRLANELSS